ncbi:hypothetical protein TELCIR_20058, partial [Teladorsagia circumcincta]
LPPRRLLDQRLLHKNRQLSLSLPALPTRGRRRHHQERILLHHCPPKELVVDYFNKRSPFDYISPETSASISDRGYADPCTLVVAMVYLDRLRVNDK